MSPRDPVRAIINDTPDQLNVTGDDRCGPGSVRLTAGGCTGTLHWYATPTSTASLTTGGAYNTPNLTAPITTYYVSCSSAAGCVSARRPVSATVVTPPGSPTVTSGSNCGNGRVRLTASGCAGGTINWYATSNSPTSLTTGAIYNTPSLTATTTYYVSCSSTAGCVSPIVSATATINPMPAVPRGDDNDRCGPGPLTLTASNCSGTLNWYATKTGGTALFTGPSYYIPNLTNKAIYFVSCKSVNGCESARDSVIATMNAVPSMPTGNDGAHCGPGRVTLTASGCTGVYNWYSTPGSNTAISTEATFTTPTLTANATYYVSCITESGCESTNRDAATATIIAQPSATASSTAASCNPLTGTVNSDGRLSLSSFPAGAHYAYSPGTTYTGTVTTYTSASAIPASGLIVSNLPNPAADQIYTIRVLNANDCFTDVSVTLAHTVSCTCLTGAPTATGASLCGPGSVTLTASGCGGTYQWYAVNSGGSVLGRGASFITPGLTATTTYYVSCSANGCESNNRARATATINAGPTAHAGGDLTGCAGSVVSLSGTATGGTPAYRYEWSPATGLSSATVANPALTAPSTTSYTLTVRDSKGCTGVDAVLVTVLSRPLLTTGPSLSLCAPVSTVLSTTVSAGQPPYAYSWLPAGSLSATNVANPTATPATTTSYTVTVTDSKGCTTRGTVGVTVGPAPAAPESRTFVNTCPIRTVSLASLLVAGQELYANNTHTGPPLTASQVSSLATSGTYYLFAIRNGCYSEPAPIRVFWTNCDCQTPATATAGRDRLACAGLQISLIGSSVGGSATQGRWSIVSGGGTLSSTDLTGTPSSVSYTPGPSTTAVTLRLTTNDPDGSGPCVPEADELTINFSRPVVEVGNASLCLNGSLVLNASTRSGTSPYSFAWSPATGLSSTTVVNPTASPTATLTYTVVATDANGCQASAQSVVIVAPAPSFTGRAVPPTCDPLTQQVKDDGQLILSGFSPSHHYAYQPGGRYTGSATYETTPAIPADGVLVRTLAYLSGRSESYTVRVFNPAGCFTDVPITTPPVVVECCKQTICIPFTVKRISRR